MANTKEKATRLHEILDRVIAKFSNEEDQEISLAEATMEDGTVISYENTEVGTAVMVLPEEGEPTPAPDGEYQISESEILVVSDGVIERVESPTPEAEEVDEEVEAEEEKPDTKDTNDTELEDEDEELESEKSDPMGFFNPERFKELVDLSKEGFYTIQFSVSNNKIEWGNLFSESFQELSDQKGELETKLSEKDEEIANMKTKFEEDLKLIGETIKESGIIQAPVEKETKTLLTKSDLIARRLEDQRKEKSIY
ncbi:MAG: hypothetical protein R6V17_04730 [Halanaerobacter sp.]